MQVTTVWRLATVEYRWRRNRPRCVVSVTYRPTPVVTPWYPLADAPALCSSFTSLAWWSVGFHRLDLQCSWRACGRDRRPRINSQSSWRACEKDRKSSTRPPAFQRKTASRKIEAENWWVKPLSRVTLKTSQKMNNKKVEIAKRLRNAFKTDLVGASLFCRTVF